MSVCLVGAALTLYYSHLRIHSYAHILFIVDCSESM